MPILKAQKKLLGAEKRFCHSEGLNEYFLIEVKSSLILSSELFFSTFASSWVFHLKLTDYVFYGMRSQKKQKAGEQLRSSQIMKGFYSLCFSSEGDGIQ